MAKKLKKKRKKGVEDGKKKKRYKLNHALEIIMLTELGHFR